MDLKLFWQEITIFWIIGFRSIFLLYIFHCHLILIFFSWFLAWRYNINIKQTGPSRWCAGNHRHLMWKCQRNEFRGGHLGFLAASWIYNGYLISLYSIYGNNHLYQFWYFYHKVNDRYTNYHILPFFHSSSIEISIFLELF